MKNPEYLKHPKNGRVFPWTEYLAEYNGMIPCDANGNPLHEDCDTPDAEPFKTPDIIRSVVDSSGLGDPENREQLDIMLDNVLKEGIADGIHRKSLPYDGVMGMPLEWVPDQDCERFVWNRNLLLNNYSHEEIVEYIELYPKYIAGKLDDSPFPKMYRELLHAIDFLVLIRKAHDLGDIEGLRMLGGGDAVLGRSRHLSNLKFGEKYGRQQTETRKAEWQLWNNEASRLVENNSALKGKTSELARKVKKNLHLDETIQAIRKRLNIPT